MNCGDMMTEESVSRYLGFLEGDCECDAGPGLVVSFHLTHLPYLGTFTTCNWLAQL